MSKTKMTGIEIPKVNKKAKRYVTLYMENNYTPDYTNMMKYLGFQEFSNTENYTNGDVILYDGFLYIFNTNHTAGDWDESEVTVINLVEYMNIITQ